MIKATIPIPEPSAPNAPQNIPSIIPPKNAPNPKIANPPSIPSIAPKNPSIQIIVSPKGLSAIFSPG